ncbi:UNVERIFIED_CONTAM: hypothetical protein GTU68_028194 [Idotea baltica]|nr:hypothetical protein [Idotea baltica]
MIPKSYYQNPDTLFLAKDLLGKHLCTDFDGQYCVSKIVETEAYIAPEDKGSHAYQNKRTGRTEIMFHEGGCAYVYLCYGIHSMVNVVSGPKNSAQAILVRAVEPLINFEKMKTRPGNVCKAMGIHTSDNGESLYTKGGIWIEEGKEKIEKSNVVASPRVGIAYAKEWALKNWRFYIKEHPSISKPLLVKYD